MDIFSVYAPIEIDYIDSFQTFTFNIYTLIMASNSKWMFHREVIEIAKIASGKLAVDLGTGARFITEGLIQKGVKVMAVGQSGSMLRIMKERIAKNK